MPFCYNASCTNKVVNQHIFCPTCTAKLCIGGCGKMPPAGQAACSSCISALFAPASASNFTFPAAPPAVTAPVPGAVFYCPEATCVQVVQNYGDYCPKHIKMNAGTPSPPYSLSAATYPCDATSVNGCTKRVPSQHSICSVTCYKSLSGGLLPFVAPDLSANLNYSGPLFECLGGCAELLLKPNSICATCEGVLSGRLPVRMAKPAHYIAIDPPWGPINSEPKKNRLPHKCTRCQSPAFIMARTVECSNSQCPCYKAAK